MNKNVSKLLAMGVVATSLVVPTAVSADTIAMADGNLNAKTATSAGGTVTLEEVKDADLNNPNGSDVQDGPKITVKKDKFLILKGSNFDFLKETELNVTDPKEGNLTSKLGNPKIDTSVAKTFTRALTATNKDNKKSTKTLTFRIIDVKPSIDVESKEALQTMDLSQVIEGDKTGLTTKLHEIKDDSFVVKVSDGTNEIFKEVKYNVKTPSTGKEEAAPEGTTTEGTAEGTTAEGTTDSTADGENVTEDASGEVTSGTSDLPKTGAVTSTVLPALGVLGTAGALIKRRF